MTAWRQIACLIASLIASWRQAPPPPPQTNRHFRKFLETSQKQSNNDWAAKSQRSLKAHKTTGRCQLSLVEWNDSPSPTGGPVRFCFPISSRKSFEEFSGTKSATAVNVIKLMSTLFLISKKLVGVPTNLEAWLEPKNNHTSYRLAVRLWGLKLE